METKFSLRHHKGQSWVVIRDYGEIGPFRRSVAERLINAWMDWYLRHGTLPEVYRGN